MRYASTLAKVAPSRGRGSKRHERLGADAAWRRPLAGARIETSNCGVDRLGDASPPRGGADRNGCRDRRQHDPGVAPSRGRGSKRDGGCDQLRGDRSPPRGGADRNGEDELAALLADSRPLAGARIETSSTAICWSAVKVAPSRGRGSKQAGRTMLFSERGRPLAGARIETLMAAQRRPRSRRRPLAGARIETQTCSRSWCPTKVAPSRGRGSKPRLRNE